MVNTLFLRKHWLVLVSSQRNFTDYILFSNRSAKNRQYKHKFKLRSKLPVELKRFSK